MSFQQLQVVTVSLVQEFNQVVQCVGVWVVVVVRGCSCLTPCHALNPASPPAEASDLTPAQVTCDWHTKAWHGGTQSAGKHSGAAHSPGARRGEGE